MLKRENHSIKENRMPNNALNRIFNSRSVVVVGASLDEKKRGYQAIKTLLRDHYEGIIYPVNPKLDRIMGMSCYPSVKDIPDDIDLALITTPAETIPGVIEECGMKNVAGVVIIAGGFGELGTSGKKKEAEILEAARKNNVRIIGPNTSGMISLFNSLNLVGLSDVPKGNIALLTQSGNIALHIITEARLRSQKGFSYYVGVGNEADIRFHEYLQFFEDDENTKLILMYVEGLRDGRKFLQQAYQTTLKKPIVLLKSGRSATGARSAGSHTGSLAGISEVARTAFQRAGIINIENLDELFPVAETLSSLPHMKNNRIGILADGGGHATIASDILTDLGVQIPVLAESTQKKLREVLPYNASVSNPVDVAGGTDQNPAVFADCAKAMIEDESIDGLFIVGLFGGYAIRFADRLRFMEEDAAHRMGKLVAQTEKPVILQSLYNASNAHSLELLRYYNIPVYESLGIACKCVAALADYGRHISNPHPKKTKFVFKWGHNARPECEAIIKEALSEGRNVLLEPEAKRILYMHNAPVHLDRVAVNADEAVEIAKEIGGDVALKIVSPDILHKSDAGGVRLTLSNDEDVRQAFNDIISNAQKYNSHARIKGCLVSPMSSDGVEVIIGTKIDDQFGPVIMFGLGGILVEVVRDVAFRVLPLSRNAARQMIEEIRSAPILNGVRGRPPVDKKALEYLLIEVSDIIESYPQIAEMDLNPVIAHQDGLSLVDARIILKDEK